MAVYRFNFSHTFSLDDVKWRWGGGFKLRLNDQHQQMYSASTTILKNEQDP